MDRYIQGIRQRDERVLIEIYSKYSDAVYRRIKGLGGSYDDAQDAFQEALIVIYNKSQAGEIVIHTTFEAYLKKVCHYLYINKRRKKDESTVTIPDAGTLVSEALPLDEELVRQERQNLFEEAFKQLGEQCQRVLGLYFQKVSMKAIQAQLGFVSEEATRTKKYRCQKKLEELIRSDERFGELSHKNKK